VVLTELLDGQFTGLTVVLMAVVFGMAVFARFAWRQHRAQVQREPYEGETTLGVAPSYVDSWPFPPRPIELRTARSVSDDYGGVTRIPIASRRARRGA
jgi:hypothetical protein